MDLIYDDYWYDQYGISKYTQRDRLGYDILGQNSCKENLFGINWEYDTASKELLDGVTKLNEEQTKFIEYYRNFIIHKKDAVQLANCYLNGIGTRPNNKLAIKALTYAAFENNDLDSLKQLFILEEGKGAEKDVEAVKFMKSIIESKDLDSFHKYRPYVSLKPYVVNKQDEIDVKEQSKKQSKTITQNDIITQDIDKNIIVRCKNYLDNTKIMLWRLHWLKNNKKEDYADFNVKIITPNKQFSTYVQELMIGLKLKEVEVLTMQEYMAALVKNAAKCIVNDESKFKALEQTNEFEFTNAYSEVSQALSVIDRKTFYDNVYKDIINCATKFKEENNDSLITYEKARDYFEYAFEQLNYSFLGENPTFLKDANDDGLIHNYCKLLFLTEVFKIKNEDDNLICIYGYQEFYCSIYELMFKINGSTSWYNIYGDIFTENGYNSYKWENIKINYTFNISKRGKEADFTWIYHADLMPTIELELLKGKRIAVLTSNIEGSLDKWKQYLDVFFKNNNLTYVQLNDLKGQEYDDLFVIYPREDQDWKFETVPENIKTMPIRNIYYVGQPQKLKELDIKRQYSFKNALLIH